MPNLDRVPQIHIPPHLALTPHLRNNLTLMSHIALTRDRWDCRESNPARPRAIGEILNHLVGIGDLHLLNILVQAVRVKGIHFDVSWQVGDDVTVNAVPDAVGADLKTVLEAPAVDVALMVVEGPVGLPIERVDDGRLATTR